MNTAEATLYDRLGGADGLSEVIRRCYHGVLADPQLAPFFSNSTIGKLTKMQVEFMGAAFGGPQQYSGLELSWAHADRGITTEHFNRFAQHLLRALEESGVAPEDVQEVVHRLSVYKNDITGQAY